MSELEIYELGAAVIIEQQNRHDEQAINGPSQCPGPDMPERKAMLLVPFKPLDTHHDQDTDRLDDCLADRNDLIGDRIASPVKDSAKELPRLSCGFRTEKNESEDGEAERKDNTA